MEKLIIYGAGGHAKAVIDAVLKEKKYSIVGLIDDINPKKRGAGCRVLGDSGALPDLLSSGIRYCVVAIGDNSARSAKSGLVERIGFELASVIHPFSSIGKSTAIGKGTVILAGALIDPYVSIGKGVIINSGAIIGHDSLIGEFSHVALGAACGGEAIIGKCCLVGIGAIIMPKLKVGENCVVGAGSVVTMDLPDNATAVGVPAKIIKRHPR